MIFITFLFISVHPIQFVLATVSVSYDHKYQSAISAGSCLHGLRQIVGSGVGRLFILGGGGRAKNFLVTYACLALF